MPFLARSLDLPSVDLQHSGHNGPDWRTPLRSDTYSRSEAMPDALFGGKSGAFDRTGGMRCGSPECRTPRPMPWRSRRRPIFEDVWGCSKKCTLAIVQAAIRRKSEESRTSAVSESHRHRVPLGLVLLGQGWITHAQLQNALGTQRLQGGRIGECLLLEGIEGTRITRGLGIQWGRPVLTIAGLDSQKMALVMPQVFIERFGAVPLRTAGARMLYVGFESSLDASLTFSLEQMTGLKVEDGILQTEDWGFARAQFENADFVSTKSVPALDIDSLGSEIALILERERPVYSRLVKVHQFFWLRLWLEKGGMSEAGMLPLDAEDIRDYVFNFT